MCLSTGKGPKCRRLATSTHSPASYQMGTNLQMLWHLEHGCVAGDHGGQGQQQEEEAQEEMLVATELQRWGTAHVELSWRRECER